MPWFCPWTSQIVVKKVLGRCDCLGLSLVSCMCLLLFKARFYIENISLPFFPLRNWQSRSNYEEALNLKSYYSSDGPFCVKEMVGEIILIYSIHIQIWPTWIDWPAFKLGGVLHCRASPGSMTWLWCTQRNKGCMSARASLARGCKRSARSVRPLWKWLGSGLWTTWIDLRQSFLLLIMVHSHCRPDHVDGLSHLFLSRTTVNKTWEIINPWQLA